MDRVDWHRRRKKVVRGYEVVREIGRGSYGTVYLARKDSEDFAMKEVSLKHLEAEKDIEYCKQEADTMKRYSHPNLVTLHEFFQIERTLYIVMEYCEGGSLAEYLERLHKDLDEEDIIYFMIQICKPLKFLHGKNVIHRDVKTANIFMTNDRQLKLGDMALTRECSANFAMTALAGTPKYMSPEIIEGREKYDQKADIWSLGCCFYELSRRECLFSQATSFETLKEMVRMCKTTRVPLNLCDEMNSLFNDMISYEPKNRPPVDEILQRLEDHTHDPTSSPASPGKRRTSTTGPGHVPVTDQTSGNWWTNGASDQQCSGASTVSRSSSGFAEGSGTSRTSSKYSGVSESLDPLTSNRSTGFSVSSRSFGRYPGDTVHETSDYDTDTEYKLLGGEEQTWQRGQAGGKLVLGLDRWQTYAESYTSSSSMDYEVPIFGRSTNSREMSSHDGHETMCTWQQALDSKNEHAMMKLIKANIMLEASDLQRAFQLYREDSITDVAIDTICGELCQHIKGLSDKIRSVYPSYTAEKPERMVFIVMADTAVKIDTSYDIIVCHPEGYSEEGSYITYHDIRKEKRITQEESDGIAAAIHAHATSLFKSHSNIQMISGCSVKSQGFGTEHSAIDRQTCIVIYVSVKGKIPLHEKPFPVKLDEPRTGKVFPVDVREGGFQFFGGPRDYHQNLKMGCQITDLKSTGTLGAIVEKEGRTYCLTCAHVFLENQFFSTALANHGTYGETEKDRTGDIRVYQGNNTNHFGVVAHAASFTGNNQNAGIDIAVIEITDQSRTPIEGSFPDGNMETSGFTASTPMIYTKGKVFDQSGFKQHVKCHTEVVKYGSETEYTKGMFDMQGFCAKRIDYTDQYHTRNIVLNNQLVVLSAGDPNINPFAKPGDSGALVFGKHGGNWSDLRVVGLIEGGASNKTVAVTPIWDVFTYLGMDPQSGLKEFASPLLPLDSGFISPIGSPSLSQGPIEDVGDQARSQEIATLENMQRDQQQKHKQLEDKVDKLEDKIDKLTLMMERMLQK